MYGAADIHYLLTSSQGPGEEVTVTSILQMKTLRLGEEQKSQSRKHKLGRIQVISELLVSENPRLAYGQGPISRELLAWTVLSLGGLGSPPNSC